MALFYIFANLLNDCLNRKHLDSRIYFCIWVSSNEVDEPRAYDTEWSKSERENRYDILTHIYEI